MINWLRRLFGFDTMTRTPRLTRAYRLHDGKAVRVNGLERVWLVDDYENLFGYAPTLLDHPHPALRPDEYIVTKQEDPS